VEINIYLEEEMKKLLSMLVLGLTLSVVSSNAEAAQCSMELKNGRGMLLDTFRGHGYDERDACQEARQDCQRAIRSGYYRARVLTCEKVYVRMVSKTCEAELVGPRGNRALRTFLGSAYGPIGSGVKADACRDALRQCEMFRSQTRHHGGRLGQVGSAITHCEINRVNNRFGSDIDDRYDDHRSSQGEIGNGRSSDGRGSRDDDRNPRRGRRN